MNRQSSSAPLDDHHHGVGTRKAKNQAYVLEIKNGALIVLSWLPCTHHSLLHVFVYFLFSSSFLVTKLFQTLFTYPDILFVKKQTMNASCCLLYMMCKIVEWSFQQLKMESNICAKIKTFLSPILCLCICVSLLLHLSLESFFVSDVVTTMDIQSRKHHHHGVFWWMITKARGQPNELITQDL